MHVCACEFVGVAAGALGLILSMDGAEPGEATGDGLEQLGAAWSQPGATEETTDKIDKGTDRPFTLRRKPSTLVVQAQRRPRVDYDDCARSAQHRCQQMQSVERWTAPMPTIGPGRHSTRIDLVHVSCLLRHRPAIADPCKPRAFRRLTSHHHVTHSIP